MSDMEGRPLSFSELEQRIHVLPEGPVTALDPPGWLSIPTAIGVLGMVVGLLPSLLVLYLEPRMWMAYMARTGLWMSLLGLAPFFLHSIYTQARWMRRWRVVQVEQLDHDLEVGHSLHAWLVRHSRDSLEEHLRFVQMAQARMIIKIGFLAGGLDKLGILPLLVALAIQLKSYTGWDKVPQWEVFIGLFAAVTYLISMIATLMRVRLHLYEVILAEALVRKTAKSVT
jgi:hypothetical protein